ncbi:DNA polymerase epsilon subunit D [Colletotrichum siamense]|uniref:DNA polymerase epsilon subunit D n=1 Tax=Colletotrichum siamense TaxID=690259 RepID=UPI0018729455|nr:DNA polymerase epsilon subunit D [Colletotrichum siamense]KAF5494903.1 DNA polymerase epsilon subunit D [Colletotrichum siamense]
MPPRKSDASRRSDVSAARFAVMDEDPATTSTTGPTPAAPATPAAAASTAPVSAAPSSAAAGAKSTPESAKASSSTPLTMTTVLNAGSDKKDSEKAPKEKADKDSLTIEDLNLPKSIITRLAKGVLPPQSQIQANAVLAMSKSATVFINYLAAHANQNTVNANKKTVSAEDVFKALEDIEFGFLREPLEQEFAKFNQIQSAKRSSYRQKVAAKKGGAAAGAAGGVAGAAAAAVSADDSIISTASADGDAPRAKKARVDESSMTVDEADDAETEPEEEANEDEDEDEEAEEEEDEDEDEGEGSGEETQDALEEKEEGDEEDVDEAIDGDESDYQLELHPVLAKHAAYVGDGVRTFI